MNFRPVFFLPETKPSHTTNIFGAATALHNAFDSLLKKAYYNALRNALSFLGNKMSGVTRRLGLPDFPLIDN